MRREVIGHVRPRRGDRDPEAFQISPVLDPAAVDERLANRQIAGVPAGDVAVQPDDQLDIEATLDGVDDLGPKCAADGVELACRQGRKCVGTGHAGRKIDGQALGREKALFLRGIKARLGEDSDHPDMNWRELAGIVRPSRGDPTGHREKSTQDKNSSTMRELRAAWHPLPSSSSQPTRAPRRSQSMMNRLPGDQNSLEPIEQRR